MTTNLFSTYRQGENRVTATFMAILQRLSLPNMHRILRALLGDDSFSLVTFENQPKGKASTPDAKIRTGPTVWIETKTERGSLTLRQVKDHLKSVSAGEKLLLLTPDDSEPSWLDDLNRCAEDKEVVWSNFIALFEIIGEILDDKDEPPSEREAFLLREFVSMLEQEGLTIAPQDRVIVVPAGHAWEMYKSLSVYRRSRDIRYRPSDHMAFYRDGKIQKLVPRIRSVAESLNLTLSEQRAALCGTEADEDARRRKEHAEKAWRRIEEKQRRQEFDNQFMVFFLSGPDDSETIRLCEPIINNVEDRNGKPWPFVYGRVRYVTLESLEKARYTKKLQLC